MNFYRSCYQGCIALLVLLTLVFIASLAVAQHPQPNTGVVYARDYGSQNGVTLTNLIDRLGTREVTMVIDGGQWLCSNSVAWPTNIGVFMSAGSYFSIASTYTMSFRTNPFYAGPFEVFRGAGFADGTGLFTYRYPEWGCTTQYNIGLGKIGYTNLNDFLAVDRSFTMNAGTTGAFKTVTYDTGIGGTLTVYKATITTADVGTAAADTVIIGGKVFDVWSGTRTVTFTSNMTDTAIQSSVDAQSEYVPAGSTLRFLFSSGNYTSLYDQIGFSGFFGGGAIDIYGTGWGTKEYLATNQGAYLDFSVNGATDAGIAIAGQGIGVWNIRNLRIKSTGSDTLDGCIDITRTGPVYLEGCFLQGTTTNTASGIVIDHAGPVHMKNNYIELNYSSVRSDMGWAYSESNLVFSSSPHTGYWLRESSILGCYNLSQPTGDVRNLYNNCGKAFTTTNIVTW